ncbi:helix-hairpin-helix domain-containing protein [Spongiibacter sp. KMU-158]|uniref:Helix-hairpin-helix domain-containing protein n=1 Tax=Spongiibacter pelagi TaxID=2760804 RepID=A0A927C066_9GAMM|nr:helix-hairpin-helix domain-containing protein [Spongiibacter pelagi]MBD2858825.1 helix-hairpin-helix domain-containing protein [Spongiibacter pelagi]
MQPQHTHTLKQLFRTSCLGLALSALSSTGFTLDINTASAEELETLRGVGPQRAQAIVEYREQNGPFENAEDLSNVKGIGERVITMNKKELELEAAAAKRPK